MFTGVFRTPNNSSFGESSTFPPCSPCLGRNQGIRDLHSLPGALRAASAGPTEVPQPCPIPGRCCKCPKNADSWKARSNRAHKCPGKSWVQHPKLWAQHSKGWGCCLLASYPSWTLLWFNIRLLTISYCQNSRSRLICISKSGFLCLFFG